MQKKEMEKKEKKRIKGLGFLLLAFLLLFVIAGIGIGYSFFSDSEAGEIEIQAGTLDINATVTYSLNGSTVTAVGNYNPGDVLVVTVAVENAGNKSAWTKLSSVVSTTTQSINGGVYVFSGTRDAAYCSANKSTATTLANSTLTFAGDPVVLSGGTSNSPEVETASTETGYVVLDTNTHEFKVTIYFDSAAGNAFQGMFFKLNYTLNAIQYRNNSGSIPSVWS
ncbi:MAG: M73 family metallopeptidase [Acholeplasmatales bacterium]|jgi:hypothetical protein|nr:M73 family metallopeptidase [Acholeplasmatales bacterium]